MIAEMNYAYWLATIPGIGNVTIQRLLQQAGCARELYFMEEKLLRSLYGLGEKEAESLLESRKRDIQREYEKLREKGITFVSMEETAYPDRLRHIADAPYGLYVKGKLPVKTVKTVGIVGARMCSEYGTAVAKELGKQLALHGVCVISGMAKGIDSAGHRGALSAQKAAEDVEGDSDGKRESVGTTLAVLGSGIDVRYPPGNAGLYEEIVRTGCVLSEYPPGTQPLAGFFPARNRIIAGLSDALVVVEAKKRSGSLITADFALEQGKDVYAVPGRIGDTLSGGCNLLIQQGAGIISDIREFLKERGFLHPAEGELKEFINLSLEKEESLVYSCLSLRSKSIEELLQSTGLTVPELSGILAGLVQKRMITETFKNCYVRNDVLEK